MIALAGRWILGQAHQASQSASVAATEENRGYSAPSSDSAAGRANDVIVDIEGRVRRPGVYTLKSGARTYEAIRMAGGAIRQSDTAGVNLAARVVDGALIVVGSAPKAASPGSEIGSADSGPISLSSATVEQLDGLDGIGPALAKRIIDWRTAHGGFSSLSDLDKVSGIGPSKLESLRSQVVP